MPTNNDEHIDDFDMEAETYNEKFTGSYGEMGRGSNARVKFLQASIKAQLLDKITLIQDIQGSETWKVRDLFQRDVDEERVLKDILPYLENQDLVKYFNPLTLVLLPLEEDHSVTPELRLAEVVEVREGKRSWVQHEVEGLFRFRVSPRTNAVAMVEYDSGPVKLVAIDGQHRLSALKRWFKKQGGASALKDWSIPVVILGIVKDDPEIEESPTILEIVRKTFVYINTRAEQVNEARRILLDDESINKLCVQEMIEVSHANDVAKEEEKNPDILPLLFYDWRGEMRHNKPRRQASALLSTTELLGWMEHYILGEDGDDQQKARLQIKSMVEPLETTDLSRLVSHTDSKRLRAQFREIMYHGIRYLLENLTPNKQFIRKLNSMEERLNADSDIAQHAFHKLRFGFHHAGEAETREVELFYRTLEEEELSFLRRNTIPALMRDVIGMRGVISAFAHLKRHRDEVNQETVDWEEYSKWFVKGMNKLIKQGWFKDWAELEGSKKNLLTHVVYEPSGNIRNYKFPEVDIGLGSLLALLVLKEKTTNEAHRAMVWGELSENISRPVLSGFKRVRKAELRNEPLGADALTALVNELAGEDITEYLETLKEYLSG